MGAVRILGIGVNPTLALFQLTDLSRLRTIPQKASRIGGSSL